MILESHPLPLFFGGGVEKYRVWEWRGEVGGGGSVQRSPVDVK